MSAISRAFQGLVSLAALPLAAGCALAALAGLAGGLNGWLDIPTHFAPLWAIGGLAAAGLSLFGLPEFPRRAVLIYAALALGASGALIVPEFLAKSTKAASDAPRQLRLVQFNAWGKRNADYDGSLAWLQESKADVIVMPEPPHQLVNGLKKAGYHLSCFDAANSYCAVAILSREAPLGRGVVARNDGRSHPPLARAVLPAPGGGSFTVVGAHFVWPTEPHRQSWQRERLGEVIDQSGPRERLIVAGDFNSAPWSSARRQDDRAWGLERRTRALFSWPTKRVSIKGHGAPFPILPIDHVYAGADWRTVSVERGPMLGSDHYPVVVTLALAPSGSLRIEHGR